MKREADDSDYDLHENERNKRTRRAPNPSVKAGEPIFSTPLSPSSVIPSANMGASSVHSHPPSHPVQHILNNTLSNNNVNANSNYPIDIMSLNGLNSHHGHGQGHGHGMPHGHHAMHHTPIHDKPDDDDKGDELSPQDMAIISDPELKQRLQAVPFDDDASKSGELSKVDVRNGYFFSVMTTMIDFMVERKTPCKQITRLYAMCGQFLLSTHKFPDIKTKTISNEYSCANSWTSKVQQFIEIHGGDTDSTNLVVSKETVGNMPNPFGKYFEPAPNDCMRVKAAFVDVFRTFVHIREQMRTLKQYAGCVLAPRDDHVIVGGKVVRGKRRYKAGLSGGMMGYSQPRHHIMLDGVPVAVNPYEGVSEAYREALEDKSNKDHLAAQLDGMVAPAGLNTGNLGSIMALDYGSGSGGGSGGNNGGNADLQRLMLASVNATFGRLPPLAYPLPYPIVPEGAMGASRNGEMKPFLTYIPALLVPVCVTPDQYAEYTKHLDAEQKKEAGADAPSAGTAAQGPSSASSAAQGAGSGASNPGSQLGTLSGPMGGQMGGQLNMGLMSGPLGLNGPGMGNLPFGANMHMPPLSMINMNGNLPLPNMMLSSGQAGHGHTHGQAQSVPSMPLRIGGGMVNNSMVPVSQMSQIHHAPVILQGGLQHGAEQPQAEMPPQELPPLQDMHGHAAK